MIRTRFALIAVGLLLSITTAGFGQSEIHYAAGHNFRVVTVVDGLEVPWAMAWLPNGDLLVTERPGRLRIVRDGVLLPDAVPGVPEVFARGQGGLMDVVMHPDFASNRLVYLSYSKPVDDNSTTAVVRGRFENDRLNDVEEVFEADTRGHGHYGSRIAALFPARGAAAQMRYRSPFVQELAEEGECPGGARFFCLYSEMDNFVLPAATAVLENAEENLHLPYLGHCSLLYSPRVARAVADRLRAD